MSGPATTASLFAGLTAGKERRVSIDGEAIVIVSAAPSGLPVILTEEGLRHLQTEKVGRLRIVRGQVRACGGRSRPLAARVLTGTVYDTTKLVKYRNGNSFDLRPSNLVVVPWGLVSQVRHPCPQSSAAQRLEQLMRE